MVDIVLSNQSCTFLITLLTHSDSQEGALTPGFIASVTSDAVFVRFLNHVTGRAGLSQLSDTFVSDPKRSFKEGQSVMAQVRRWTTLSVPYLVPIRFPYLFSPFPALYGPFFRINARI